MSILILSSHPFLHVVLPIRLFRSNYPITIWYAFLISLMRDTRHDHLDFITQRIRNEEQGKVKLSVCLIKHRAMKT
jgi:hypothetical protein